MTVRDVQEASIWALKHIVWMKKKSFLLTAEQGKTDSESQGRNSNRDSREQDGSAKG